MDYPISLRVTGRDCVVVGGGEVALRKARALVRAGARLRVVSPSFIPGFRLLKARLVRRRFTAKDVAGAFLAISATDDATVNREVFRACRRRGTPVNVVDQPKLCTFTAMSVLRRGPVTVAISTGGASPALAKALRKELQRIFPRTLAAPARSLGAARRRIMRLLPSSPERTRILKSLVGGGKR
jgi:siroheme synthase-like protein